MATVVFGGVTLSNPSPPAPVTEIRVGKIPLLDGGQALMTLPNYGTRYQFTCFAEDYNELEALIALIGTRTTLTIDLTELKYFHITSFIPNEATPHGWPYTIEFSRTTVVWLT